MNKELRFRIGEVAALVGMTPDSIRAWERRYGAVVPERSERRTRRYSMDDVERLQRIKLLAATRSVRLSIRQADGMMLSALLDAPSAGASERSVDNVPWRSAADLSEDLQMFLDSEGRIIDATIAVARSFGIVRGRLIGTRFAELVEAYDRAKADRLYRGAAGRHLGWELNLKTDPPALYRFDSWPLKREGGTLIFVRGANISNTDIDWGGGAL